MSDWKFPKKWARCLLIFIVFFLVSVSISPLILAPTNDGSDNISSRGARAITIINGTNIVNLQTKIYSDVWVKDNATLIADGVISNIQGRLNVTDNANVIIRGGAKIKAYSVTAYCKSFIIEGNGEINCTNGKSSPDHGYNSIVYIHLQDELIISDGKIKCFGQKGQPAPFDSNTQSYNGGYGIISLRSNKWITISDDSLLYAIGGRGGTGVENLFKGGIGGNGKIEIEVNNTNTTSDTKYSISISESTIKAHGGIGGDGYPTNHPESKGGDGGAGEIFIKSFSNHKDDEFSIDRCTIQATSGLGGAGASPPANGLEGDAAIDFDTKKKLYVDKYKLSDENLWLDPKSTRITSSTEYLRINALGDAHLYTPILDSEGIRITPGNGEVYIYYVLQINVMDNPDGGNSIEGATVTIPGENPDVSDFSGITRFLIPGLHIKKSLKDEDKVKKYTATGTYSGATGMVSDITAAHWDVTMNTYYIYITLVSVSIKSIIVGGTTYDAEDMVVYGTVTIKGTAESSFTITSVEIRVGNKDPVIAIKISGNNDWSQWSFDWDSTTYPENSLVKLEAIASTEEFKDSDYINLTVSETPVPPTLTVLSPYDNFIFDQTETESIISIKGTVIDENWDSKLLEHSKEVIAVNINIKNSAGNSVLNSVLNKDNSGLRYIDASHNYNWSFNWDTDARLVSDTTKFQYGNGNYIIEITAVDDTKPIALVSPVITRNVTLHHIQKPTAVIKEIIAVKNAKFDKVSSPIGFENTKVFKFQSDKGKDNIKIRFDLSSSYDPDNTELKYFVEFGDGSRYDWENNSIAENEYIFASSKKVIKSYQVIIKVRDTDDAENDRLIYEGTEIYNLTIDLEFRPEDPPPVLPTGEILPLPISRFEIQLIFIILLIVFNIAGAFLILSKYKKINQRRKAREVAMDAARQKKLETGAKKKEDIYSQLEFVSDEGAEGPKHVAVAGAAGAMALPTDEAIAAAATEEAKSAEPEAPQLISVEQPVYESGTAPTTTEAFPAAETTQTQPPATTTTTTPAPVTPTPAQVAAPDPGAPAPVTPAPVTPTPAQPATTQPATAQPTQQQQQQKQQQEEQQQ
jgi:hypothetical protein